MSGENAGLGRTGPFSAFQELCTDPCDMGPCITMLKCEAMAAEDWHDNGPQDPVLPTCRHAQGKRTGRGRCSDQHPLQIGFQFRHSLFPREASHGSAMRRPPLSLLKSLILEAGY